jgi:hypothetical protein
MNEKETTWLDEWEAAKNLWLDAEQAAGLFVVSSKKITKVLSKKPWRITGVRFVEWDKGMPIPVVDMLLELRSQLRLRLDVVLQHTAVTGQPWPTSVCFCAGETFTLAGIQNYRDCEMLVELHWERLEACPSCQDIQEQIGAPGVA